MSSGVSMRSSRASVKDEEEEEGEEEEDEGEGSEGSGGTDVDDRGEEEEGSEMLLDLGSREASEAGDEDAGADGEESDGEDDAEEDEEAALVKPVEDAMSVTEDGPGFGVGEAQDLDIEPSQATDTLAIQELKPEPISDAEADIVSINGADAMSIVDPEADVMSIAAEDPLSITQANTDSAGIPQMRLSPVNREVDLDAKDAIPTHPNTPSDAGNSFVDVVGYSSPEVPPVDGLSAPSPIDITEPRETNGHSDTATSPLRGTSTFATPDPQTPAAPTDAPSPAPTSPVVRKLTLKFKALEPPTSDSPVTRRRSSRHTSVSTPVTGGGDSDSEVDGLAKDAELPIEELMRRYGYVGADEVGQDQGSTPTEATGDDATTARIADSDDGDEDEAEDEDTKAAGALLGLEDVTAVQDTGVRPPFLLRGTLRPYQQAGMEWLVSGYVRGTNGILADEMGLG